ncbi:hypothetical protein BA895_04800 [Humibacillus sp. DSM 29435]|uniref:PhzF family phenazine biosynthesis protein n=1 Tax=Humibacillus sp. DSM 29435 TaxID=1869167 RepID=UPI0008724857|nr:PhzF family phenazine biosynthesis protein [Humibacillus sp. DSM 29435]OFE15837.1 hypothetical protein BA895_04800 [Humibacillus sp. DSM 29435]
MSGRKVGASCSDDVRKVRAPGPDLWRARDPFPWGGVVEDPATGAAAAAFAGYLRSRGRASTGDTFVVEQWVEMGRPSHIEVELLERAALVSGHAVRICVDSSRDLCRLVALGQWRGRVSPVGSIRPLRSATREPLS